MAQTDWPPDTGALCEDATAHRGVLEAAINPLAGLIKRAFWLPPICASGFLASHRRQCGNLGAERSVWPRATECRGDGEAGPLSDTAEAEPQPSSA